MFRTCYPLALSTSSCTSSEWSHPIDQVKSQTINNIIEKKKIIDGHFNFQSQEWARKPNNTTVIRVNHNSNQNQLNQNQYRSNIVGYPGHPTYRENYGMRLDAGNEPLYDPVTPKDYESHDFDANPHEEKNSRIIYEKDNLDLHNSPADEQINYSWKENDFSINPNSIQRHVEIESKTITTVEVHQSSGPPAPPCPPPLSYKWQSGMHKFIK